MLHGDATDLVWADTAVGDQALQILGGGAVYVELHRHFTILVHLQMISMGPTESECRKC